VLFNQFVGAQQDQRKSLEGTDKTAAVVKIVRSVLTLTVKAEYWPFS
jgi:hypothetical protein